MEKSSELHPPTKRRLIPVERILERPGLNARFESNEVGELAEMIKKHGLLFPPLVVQAEDREPLGPGQFFYYLVHGHRRVAAIRLLKLPRCSCSVATGLTLEEQQILNLAENARENLTPAEIAERCASLLAGVARGRRRLSADELGERIGYSGSHIRNLVRLRQQLHPDLWEMMIRTGHKAPVAALLSVVVKPLKEQLEAWGPIGAAIGMTPEQDGRVRRLSWRSRGRRLVEEAAHNHSAEFVRGATWLFEQLTRTQDTSRSGLR